MLFTGTSFAHLTGISALGMFECSDEQVDAARSLGLPLSMRAGKSSDFLHYPFDWREGKLDDDDASEDERGTDFPFDALTYNELCRECRGAAMARSFIARV